MENSEKKPNFYPEGWLVSCFHNFKIDQERAQKFRDMRVRLCDKLGKDNEACRVNNLLTTAMDLLLAYEEEYVRKNIQGDKLP
jgi:hypothetical protein